MSEPVCSRTHGPIPGDNCWVVKAPAAVEAAAALARETLGVLREQGLAALMAVFILLGGPALVSAQAKPAGTPHGVRQSVAGQSSVSQPALSGPVHIVPFGRNGSTITNTAAPAGAHLTYWGGPVISQVHVVAVFWGTQINTAITAPGAMDQFFSDITNSRYFDLLTEYSTTGVTGSGTPATSSNQSINRGVFDTSVTITPSLCNITPPATCTIDDAQIRTELTNQIAAGALPQPVTDLQGNVESFYMIYFPPGVTITDGGLSSCVAGGFCAYHSDTPTGLVPYGVEPDFSQGACSTGCGAGTLFQRATEITSHELSEAVTDALIGSVTTFGPPLAWYDPNPATGGSGALGEIGDICNAQEVSVTAGASTYMVQQEFSNLQNDCVSAPPVFNLTPPASAAAGIPFNLPLTIQSSVNAATLTGYLGTVHFTSSDGQAVLPADYTFTSTDAGTHTFPITLKSTGSQTITVTDIHSAGFNGSITLNVAPGPDLTITKSHTGNFNQGQTGVSYTILVSNLGAAATSGTVTVNDALPAGLTFVQGTSSIGGKGWTCDTSLAPALSCSRSDALAAGASYPVITLTVDVALNAPSQLTNTATVSGGGETNIANDSAGDPTTVTAPDLAIAKQHTGNFTVGQTGATYTISVSNAGNGASLGSVTVSDTLPAGLSATAIAGTGWACGPLPALSCTRSDVLGAGANYPAISLTVDVTAASATTVTNTASVSGGNDNNTANNTAQDPTVIDPPPAPDLTITKSHTAPAFVQGQSGSYSITVGNAGVGASSGLVTVTDPLPAGMTAASIGGTGWTCSAITSAPLTCTRSDALQPNAAYPAISLTVNVAANAPSSLTNTASVSGGGDSNTANNTASDVTQIVPPVVDLQTSLLSSSGTFDQGQTNASYVIAVSNQGNVSSSGAVTVTNTLGTGLTATAISGTGWTCTVATLTCTRSDALAAGAGFAAITVTFDVANTAPASATATATASGGGDNSPANNSATFSANITPAIAISLAGAGNSTVTAGSPATYNLSLTLGPAAGTVSFACNGLPTGAACSFSPASLTSSGSEAVTVSTTARAASVPADYRFPGGNAPTFVLLLVLAALATLGLRDHRLRRRLAFGAAGCLLLLVVGGCGGGGTPTTGPGPTATPTPNPNGTPAGTYVVTVTATGSSSQASQPFTLVVK